MHGPEGPTLAGLLWEGTRWDGVGSPKVTRRSAAHDVTTSPIRDSGENGLARMWLEIRTWVSWCDCAGMRGEQQAVGRARSFDQFLEELDEANVSLSQIRRADMEKWVAGARDWEQSPGSADRST